LQGAGVALERLGEFTGRRRVDLLAQDLGPTTLWTCLPSTDDTVMMTNVRDQRTRRPTGRFTWGVLLISGLVLLVLHNSAWASAWVTASAILFVMLVALSVAVRVHNRG
jgi:hypothetical protein